LDIQLFDTLPSTQAYLIEKIEQNILTAPIAILAKEQSAGLGSRDNEWVGGKGNFFLSFAVKLEDLPIDLPLHAASIYFSYLMKETLMHLGEEVWLKWPNDLYKKKEKIGGTITKQVNKTLVCGMGINLKNVQNGYASLQSEIEAEKLLQAYIESIKMFPSWKQVFSGFAIEFELGREFLVHIENYQKSLMDACLQSDGSLIIEGKRVYSLR